MKGTSKKEKQKLRDSEIAVENKDTRFPLALKTEETTGLLRKMKTTKKMGLDLKLIYDLCIKHENHARNPEYKKIIKAHVKEALLNYGKKEVAADGHVFCLDSQAGLLAVGSHGSTLKIHDLNSVDCSAIQTLRPYNRGTFSVSFSAGASRLATSSVNDKIYIWSRQDDGNYTQFQDLSDVVKFRKPLLRWNLQTGELAIADFQSLVLLREDLGPKEFKIFQKFGENRENSRVQIFDFQADYLVTGVEMEGDDSLAHVYKRNKLTQIFEKVQSLEKTKELEKVARSGWESRVKAIRMSSDASVLVVLNFMDYGSVYLNKVVSGIQGKHRYEKVQDLVYEDLLCSSVSHNGDYILLGLSRRGNQLYVFDRTESKFKVHASFTLEDISSSMVISGENAELLVASGDDKFYVRTKAYIEQSGENDEIWSSRIICQLVDDFKEQNEEELKKGNKDYEEMKEGEEEEQEEEKEDSSDEDYTNRIETLIMSDSGDIVSVGGGPEGVVISNQFRREGPPGCQNYKKMQEIQKAVGEDSQNYYQILDIYGEGEVFLGKDMFSLFAIVKHDSGYKKVKIRDKGRVELVKFLPRGNDVVLVDPSSQKFLQIFELVDNKSAYKLKQELVGHSFGISAIHVHYDASLIISSAENKYLLFWENGPKSFFSDSSELKSEKSLNKIHKKKKSVVSPAEPIDPKESGETKSGGKSSVGGYRNTYTITPKEDLGDLTDIYLTRDKRLLIVLDNNLFTKKLLKTYYKAPNQKRFEKVQEILISHTDLEHGAIDPQFQVVANDRYLIFKDPFGIVTLFLINNYTLHPLRTLAFIQATPSFDRIYYADWDSPSVLSMINLSDRLKVGSNSMFSFLTHLNDMFKPDNQFIDLSAAYALFKDLKLELYDKDVVEEDEFEGNLKQRQFKVPDKALMSMNTKSVGMTFFVAR